MISEALKCSQIKLPGYELSSLYAKYKDMRNKDLVLYEHWDSKKEKRFLILMGTSFDLTTSPWYTEKEAILQLIMLTLPRLQIDRVNEALQAAKKYHDDVNDTEFKETNFYLNEYKILIKIFADNENQPVGHMILCPATRGDGRGGVDREPPKEGFLVKKAEDGTISVTDLMKIDAATQLMEKLTHKKP